VIDGFPTNIRSILLICVKESMIIINGGAKLGRGTIVRYSVALASL